MHREVRLKSWLLYGVTALLVAAGLTIPVWRTQADNPPLWTEKFRTILFGQSSWTTIAKHATPAVVNISTTQMLKNPLASLPNRPGSPQDELHQLLGTLPKTIRTHSLGSGFLIRSDGFLVTNNHLVEAASDIKVKLEDGREFVARLVGQDDKTDLALLKIEAEGLPTLPFGDSDALQVGDAVMAIGNPLGLEGTVTTGIVSAKSRVIGEGPYDDFIQTDASINPGNSGGPLMNAAGQVVGINTAIASQSGGSVGIGFSLPINQVKSLLPQLGANGHVTRGWLGVGVQPVTEILAKALHLPDAKGALVTSVLADSPAGKAGLRVGDVIKTFDGHALGKEQDLPRQVAATRVGQEVDMSVIREERPLTLRVKVAELPQPRHPPVMPPPDRGRLGLALRPMTPTVAQELGLKDQTGVVVAQVQDGSVAAEAGILPGDVIVEVNRKPVQNLEELRHAVEGQNGSEPTLFLIHRQENTVFVALDIGGKLQG